MTGREGRSLQFRLLASKLQNLADKAVPVREFFLEPDGKGLRLCCMDFEPDEVMFSSICSLLCPRKENAAYETFYCFRKKSGELLEFLPQELTAPEGRFVYDGPEGRFAVSIQFGFFSLYSAEEQATYIWLCPDKHSLDGFVSHPFHMEFSWWAQRNGLTFLHSACVGANEKGILISGAGGSGKTTLAIAALLSGMLFLSDDYLLVRPGQTPEAIRLYSTAYLTEEILDQLPECKKNVYWASDARKKGLLDLASFNGNVLDRLSLSAVVIPHIAHADRPVIEANADIRRLIPLLSSTSYQNRELRNKDVFFNMMRLLKGLPAYHFMLTDDIRRNAEHLQAWVEKL